MSVGRVRNTEYGGLAYEILEGREETMKDLYVVSRHLKLKNKTPAVLK